MTKIHIGIAVTISFLITIALLFGFYFFMPYGIIDITGSNGMLGTSLTTIIASDTIKGSRTTINDNFTALNNGKIEVSTTSLPNVTSMANLASVGTITSGTWNGTSISFAKGGTGTTTIGERLLLYGAGAGLNVVATGTEGQLLKIVGGVPTWSSETITLNANNIWTGGNVFTASTTINDLWADGMAYGSYFAFAPSDNLKLSADTCSSTVFVDASNWYTKKTMKVYRYGWVRAKYDGKFSGCSQNASAVWVDGVQLGTNHCDTSTTTYTDDVYVSADSEVQLRVLLKDGATTASWANFRLYWDDVATSTAGKVTSN